MDILKGCYCQSKTTANFNTLDTHDVMITRIFITNLQVMNDWNVGWKLMFQSVNCYELGDLGIKEEQGSGT